MATHWNTSIQLKIWMSAWDILMLYAARLSSSLMQLPVTQADFREEPFRKSFHRVQDNDLGLVVDDPVADRGNKVKEGLW